MLIYVSNPIAKATTSPPPCFPPPYFSSSIHEARRAGQRSARTRPPRCVYWRGPLVPWIALVIHRLYLSRVLHLSLQSVRRLVPSSPSEHGSHYRFAGCCSAHTQEKNRTISPALSLQCMVNAKKKRNTLKKRGGQLARRRAAGPKRERAKACASGIYSLRPHSSVPSRDRRGGSRT